MTPFSEHSRSIASGYAKALFQLAEEQNTVSEIWTDLTAIHNVFMQNNELIRSFESTHSLDDEGCKSLISPLLDSFNPLVDKTLQIMASENHLAGVPALFHMYTPYYETYNNIGHVYIKVAVPIEATIHDALTQKFQRLFNLKRAILNVSVDPSLVGGLYVEYNGQRFDATIKHKLHRLETTLSHV